MPRPLPQGVKQGTYVIHPVAAGTQEIQIRGYIGWWETNQKAFVRRIEEARPDTIRLKISSEGGYFADALAIHDFLKAHPARVEVEITGLTASAATMIAMAGDHIQMSDNALFLVHYVRYGLYTYGVIEEVERAAEQALQAHRKYNEKALGLYAKRTGKSPGQLDALFKEDKWLSADEALEWGFIDAVFEPGENTGADATAAAGGLRAAAYVPTPCTLSALGLPGLPDSFGVKPIAGDDFAAWSNRLIEAIDEDEDDERTRSDVIGELAEAVGLSRGIINAILNEEDPVECPFTNAEKFPTKADARDAVRSWAGVLDASPSDAFAALEADGCSYGDEEEGAEDNVTGGTSGAASFRLDIEAMSKPDDAKTQKSTNTPATSPKSEKQPADQQQPAGQQPDEATRLQAMQSEIDALKSQNAQLAKERRAAALDGLRRACAGRLPGTVAEALVEYAETTATLTEEAKAVDPGGGESATHAWKKPLATAATASGEPVEAGLVERLTAIVAALPELAPTQRLDVQPQNENEAVFKKMWDVA